MQLKTVQDYLKQELRPLSSEEIRTATGVDIEDSPEVFSSLVGESSNARREADGRWRWKSRHYLTGFNELLQFFSLSQEGVPENELLDSYKGVRADIEKLKASNFVYALKSGSRMILYRRDQRLELPVSDDVRERYNKVSLPDAIEVHRYLASRGLKETDDVRGTQVHKTVKRKRPGSKKEGRRSKQVKLTNTHMINTGVDLTKDFKHGKDSAFS